MYGQFGKMWNHHLSTKLSFERVCVWTHYVGGEKGYEILRTAVVYHHWSTAGRMWMDQRYREHSESVGPKRKVPVTR